MVRPIGFGILGLLVLGAIALHQPDVAADESVAPVAVRVISQCRVECGALGQSTTNVECRAISAESCAALKQSLPANCRADYLPLNWCAARVGD